MLLSACARSLVDLPRQRRIIFHNRENLRDMHQRIAEHSRLIAIHFHNHARQLRTNVLA